MAHVMSLIFFPSVDRAHFDFRKCLCRDVKFKGQEPHTVWVCVYWSMSGGGGGKGR